LERKNLWAPWRAEYIQGLSKSSDCFICDDLKKPQDDDANLVLWRCDKSIVVMNRFPYNNGHLLIAPARHISDLEEAGDEELLELTRLIRESKKALSLTINPHGFNVGMNFGRCSGAGLPGHLHIHIVPRWDGDTSFMNVCTDTNVVSQSLTELLGQLKQISKEHNLPSL
jgi:ATP adenylyltransferase